MIKTQARSTSKCNTCLIEWQRTESFPRLESGKVTELVTEVHVQERLEFQPERPRIPMSTTLPEADPVDSRVQDNWLRGSEQAICWSFYIGSFSCGAASVYPANTPAERSPRRWRVTLSAPRPTGLI